MTSSVNENYIIEMVRLKIILGVFKNFYLSLDGDDYNNEQHYLQVSNMAKMAHDLHHEITHILEYKICGKEVPLERFKQLYLVGYYLEELFSYNNNNNEICIMTYINNKLNSMEHILFHYDIIID